MKLLLDTHLLLWSMSDSRKLSKLAHSLIGDPDNQPHFSVVCIWEVVIKNGRGKADFQVDGGVLRRNLLDDGYIELPVTGNHALEVGKLPLIHHDPFDRLLVAQAVVEGITLLTVDPVIAQYPGPIRKV
jgi:PIN domain nuclease of toxin-antitoxin system